MGDHGGGVSGGAADHQDAVALLDVGRLQHLRQHHRLDQEPLGRAAFADIEIEVQIGQRLLVFGNEGLARHRQHGIENSDIGHVARTHLTIDHFLARGRKTGHMLKTLRACGVAARRTES